MKRNKIAALRFNMSYKRDKVANIKRYLRMFWNIKL